MPPLRVIAVGLAFVAVACAPASSAPPAEPSPDALATALTPQQPPEYYVDQANKCFDTLDTSADPDSEPSYSILVARWERPPWLWLTGCDRENMELTTELADFVRRAEDFWGAWLEASDEAGPEYYARGCGWVE